MSLEGLQFSQEEQSQFIFPDIRRESEEIERVGQLFFRAEKIDFYLSFVERVQNQPLVKLDDDLWARLENTDSFDIEVGDWNRVADLAEQQNRDWCQLRSKLETGVALDAPLIMKVDETVHLVSGNTRLMVARAAGICPQVVLVDMSEYTTA